METNIVIHDDCLEVMQGMSYKSIDLVLTDPPYGLGYDKSISKQGNKKYGNAAAAKKDYGQTNWDQKPPIVYFDAIFAISNNCVIWGAEHLSNMFDTSRGWIVWNKKTDGNNFSDCELAYTTFNKSIIRFDFTWNGMIQENMKNKEKRYHPTQKPIELFSWCLEKYSKPNDIILDPFAGSGTTAIACLKMGRKYICVEKEQKYIDIINKRINQYHDGKLLEYIA